MTNYLTSIVAAGVQYMHNNLRRRQLGKGTTGSDFDLTVTDQTFGRDLYMKTKNIAFFVENLVYITPKLTLAPDLRIEGSVSDMQGSISYYAPADLPSSISHCFALLDVNAQYRSNATTKFYAGIAQAYQPVVIKDIIPGSVLERVDKNRKDAFGYNFEAGVTGNVGSLLTWVPTTLPTNNTSLSAPRCTQGAVSGLPTDEARCFRSTSGSNQRFTRKGSKLN
ncbi:hypothetical protein [Spirosoma koreense]